MWVHKDFFGKVVTNILNNEEYMESALHFVDWSSQYGIKKVVWLFSNLDEDAFSLYAEDEETILAFVLRFS